MRKVWIAAVAFGVIMSAAVFVTLGAVALSKDIPPTPHQLCVHLASIYLDDPSLASCEIRMEAVKAIGDQTPEATKLYGALSRCVMHAHSESAVNECLR